MFTTTPMDWMTINDVNMQSQQHSGSKVRQPWVQTSALNSLAQCQQVHECTLSSISPSSKTGVEQHHLALEDQMS